MGFKFKCRVDKMLETIINATGETVEYRPVNGGSFEICAVFDNEAQLVDPDSEQLVSSNEPAIGIRLRDLPNFPKYNDIVVAEKETYRVIDIREDGQGGASLLLHKCKVP